MLSGIVIILFSLSSLSFATYGIDPVSAFSFAHSISLTAIFSATELLSIMILSWWRIFNVYQMIVNVSDQQAPQLKYMRLLAE